MTDEHAPAGNADDQTPEPVAPEQTPEQTPPEPNLFAGVEPTPEPAPEPASPEQTPGTPHARPDDIPEQFWDAEKGEVRVPQLVKSWKEATKKFREKNEPPEEYDLQLPEGVEALGEDDIQDMKDLGLTNEQAQKFVEYFYRTVVPEVQGAHLQVQQERLGRTWGMEPNSEPFQHRLATLKAWANQNLPDAAVAEMSKTANGIEAIHKMMQAAEAGHGISPNATSARPSPEDLQKLMDDPRYWQDDQYREYVRTQFQAAYD